MLVGIHLCFKRLKYFNVWYVRSYSVTIKYSSLVESLHIQHKSLPRGAVLKIVLSMNGILFL